MTDVDHDIRDHDIREALDRATRHLHTPVTLLTDVRTGGHRRLVRRRTVLAAGLATASAGATAGTWRLAGRHVGPQVASRLLDGVTRGDLAGDEAYLRRVLDVWRRRMRSADVDTIGAPHVIWAGRTPAGPVAAVAQRHHPQKVAAPDGDLDFATVGMVEPTPDGPAIPETAALVKSRPAHFRSAIVVGEQRTVLVVLDVGRPVRYSPNYTYTDDGRIRRAFHPLGFDDGAAVRYVPSQRDRITVALRQDPAPGEVVELANFDALAYAGRPAQGFPTVLDRPLPGRERALPAPAVPDPSWGEAALRPWRDPFSMLRFTGAPEWYIWGATPDRRLFVVRSEPHNDDPQRLLGLIGRPDGDPSVVYGGLVDRGAPLPVRMRLPGRQGVVVASEGAVLRYRAASRDWLPVTGDAALLPDSATEVEVTRPGSAPARVPVR